MRGKHNITLLAVKKSMVRRRKQTNGQKASSQGFIRIISGLWRGRKLPVHNAEGLRPTTDRVKETLFNWLAQDVVKAKCLDLFAGSGSLGFEAASRQADKVTLVEMNSHVYRQLTTNMESLRTNNLEVFNDDALLFLEKVGQPYDIVFIDPPFRQNILQRALDLLEHNGWLAENAIVYVETEKELELDGIPKNWHLFREKTAGQVTYRLFERHAR